MTKFQKEVAYLVDSMRPWGRGVIKLVDRRVRQYGVNDGRCWTNRKLGDTAGPEKG